jgi:hypothetical protein
MIAVPSSPCTFKIGDVVIYRPSARGLGLAANDTEKLVPGKTYKVNAIQRGNYLLVEGYNHPGGGLFWTEFAAIS